MKKHIALILCSVLVCLIFSGCCMSHEWVEASCEAPKTCSKCGETEGEALAHEWADADCVTAKTCSVCGETEGEALGHDWADADCVTAKTCTVCGETEGEALGHSLILQDMDDTTRTDVCTVCSTTVDTPVADLATESLELLVGKWTADSFYNGNEVNPLEETFTFEFAADGAVISQLPLNPGEGTVSFNRYNSWLEQFFFETEINGKGYDIVVYVGEEIELLWWHRDLYRAYVCHQN